MSLILTPLSASYGALLEVGSYRECLDLGRSLRELVYQYKVLAIRGLGKVTPEELWELHTNLGTPWSPKDYVGTIKEPSVCTDPNKHVPYFATDIYNKTVGGNSMPWHRDIPWHAELLYPMRSLYAHDTYKTPTRFVDCDVLKLDPDTYYDLTEFKVELQYWYDRQFDTDEYPTLYRTKEIPVLHYHEGRGKDSVVLNSFSVRPDKYSDSPAVPYQVSPIGGWFLGATFKGSRLSDAKYLDWMSRLHQKVCTPENTLTWKYKKHDLVIFDNMSGVMHNRPVVDPSDGKRIFSRMNVRHYWQTKELENVMLPIRELRSKQALPGSY